MEAIRVSHVQHFSVNDGEGIRTTVFLSGCPLRCSWCCNPETWDADPDTAAYTPAARKILGRFMSVDEILGEIRRYSIFHGSSGGGVTWSGESPFSSLPNSGPSSMPARISESIRPWRHPASSLGPPAKTSSRAWTFSSSTSSIWTAARTNGSRGSATKRY